jgi:hypothetical protein
MFPPAASVAPEKRCSPTYLPRLPLKIGMRRRRQCILDCRRPKEEEEFLAQHPSWLRKLLEGDFALTPDEQADMTRSNFPEIFGQAEDAYFQLLRRYPERLREYRNLRKKLAVRSELSRLPSVTPGRPRQDTLAQEAKKLQQGGLSQPEIASELNRRHPDRRDRKGNLHPLTAEAVRKMLARRYGTASDKT